MTTDVHAIPREVWRRFVDSGGLNRVVPMCHFAPLKTVPLETATAQVEIDNQRRRFKRLIVELFPPDRVEAFIAAHLETRTYPEIGSFGLNAGFMELLDTAIKLEAEPLPLPFDIMADRTGRLGGPRLDASEYRYAVRLLQLRPGLTLKGFFAGQTSAESLGYAARMSCAATGIMIQAVDKRGGEIGCGLTGRF